MKAPENSGTLFFNYKGSFSNVLMAVVDANYKFILANVGGYGSQHDSGIFMRTRWAGKFAEKSMRVPESEFLPNTNIKFPYYLVADSAFPLNNYIMKPYHGDFLSEREQIFNYRLSRGRRVVENAFGILGRIL